MELLLLSNSRMPDGGYLAHALGAIGAIAAGRKRALFLPFASVTVGWDEFTARVQAALAETAITLAPVHAEADPLAAIAAAEMIFVGGGNTFNLLAECRRRGLLAPIAARVRAGVPYVGWSAGSVLACRTIQTTNDMPIVDPDGFAALGLVPYQINPHYTDALPPDHQGETRRQRLAELLVANPGVMVVGLPEGDWLLVSGSTTTLHGPHPARLFHGGQEPAELGPGESLVRLVIPTG
jgi:dipeptidase E